MDLTSSTSSFTDFQGLIIVHAPHVSELKMILDLKFGGTMPTKRIQTQSGNERYSQRVHEKYEVKIGF